VSSFAPDVTKRQAASIPVVQVATLTDVSDMVPATDIVNPIVIPADCLENNDSIPIPLSKSKSKPTFDTWKRRLNTHEDTFNVHKWSGLLFALSSTTIVGTGLINGFHNDIPSFVQPLDTILNLSILVQCASSIDMANKHRRNQPEIRDQFNALAYGMIFAVLAAWLDGPFALDVLTENKMLSDVLVAGFGGFAMGYPLKGLWNKEKLIKARDDKISKTKQSSGEIDLGNLFVSGSFWINSLISPLLYMVIVATFLHPEHDRTWMLQWQNEHAGQAATYYGQVFGNTAFMWSAFVTTLRDKKLIGRSTESLVTFALMAVVPINTLFLVK
jgi:hypothetical protein